jgi:hypothetical protein
MTLLPEKLRGGRLRRQPGLNRLDAARRRVFELWEFWIDISLFSGYGEKEFVSRRILGETFGSLVVYERIEEP